MVREGMLNLARSLSQSKLSKLCNISQPIISNIINNKEFKLSSAKCREFGQWYVQFMIRSQSENQSAVTIESVQTAQEEQHSSNPGVTSQATLQLSITSPQPSTSTSDARLTFHPKLEVPRLVEWFQLNRSPSERQLIYYADLLNQSSLRAERNKVTVKSLKNWWKNYKQKQRNEMRAEKRAKKDNNNK